MIYVSFASEKSKENFRQTSLIFLSDETLSTFNSNASL